jgi:hypothetical protein
MQLPAGGGWLRLHATHPIAAPLWEWHTQLLWRRLLKRLGCVPALPLTKRVSFVHDQPPVGCGYQTWGLAWQLASMKCLLCKPETSTAVSTAAAYLGVYASAKGSWELHILAWGGLVCDKSTVCKACMQACTCLCRAAVCMCVHAPGAGGMRLNELGVGDCWCGYGY